MKIASPHIFLSYCWEDKTFANEVYEIFNAKSITLTKDDHNVSYMQSFKTFMGTIGVHDYSLMLVSKNYLQSYNCMYEVLEVLRYENYRKKIILIVLDNTAISRADASLHYIKYWQNELKSLEKERDGAPRDANLTEINDLIHHYRGIIKDMAKFIGTLQDVKRFSYDELKSMDFKPIFELIGYANDKHRKPASIINNTSEKKTLWTWVSISVFLAVVIIIRLSNQLKTSPVEIQEKKDSIVTPGKFNAVQDTKKDSLEAALRAESEKTIQLLKKQKIDSLMIEKLKKAAAPPTRETNKSQIVNSNPAFQPVPETISEPAYINELKQADIDYRNNSYENAFQKYMKYQQYLNGSQAGHVGWMYYNGKGTIEDYTEALMWFKKGSDLNDDYSRYYIGCIYRDGTGVLKDYFEALKWFTKAAEKNDGVAMSSIGGLYEYGGPGFDKNYPEAMKWYEKAYHAGYPGGMNNIGSLYEYGKGMPRNIPEAIKCYKIAAGEGNELAKKNLERLGY